MLMVRYSDKRKYRSVVVVASVANTYLPVLLWLKANWGGTIGTRPPRTKKHKVAYLWMTTSRKAATFLTDISPFVIIKRHQIQNALAAQALKKPRSRIARLTDEEWRTALRLVAVQRQLNKRGPHEPNLSVHESVDGDE